MEKKRWKMKEKKERKNEKEQQNVMKMKENHFFLSRQSKSHSYDSVLRRANYHTESNGRKFGLI